MKIFEWGELITSGEFFWMQQNFISYMIDISFYEFLRFFFDAPYILSGFGIFILIDNRSDGI